MTIVVIYFISIGCFISYACYIRRQILRKHKQNAYLDISVVWNAM